MKLGEMIELLNRCKEQFGPGINVKMDHIDIESVQVHFCLEQDETQFVTILPIGYGSH